MTGLIDKAIIVTNVETNTLALDIQPIELAVALDNTLRVLQALAENANVERQVELGSDLPATLVDKTRPPHPTAQLPWPTPRPPRPTVVPLPTVIPTLPLPPLP